jgi:uncharacterized membrane protein
MHVMWIEFGCALLIAAVNVPLILRKVPKNAFYGMRTPKTMNGSDENWYEVNYLAGVAMVWSSLIAAALMVVAGLLPFTELVQSVISMVLLLLAVLLPLVIYRKRFF